MLLSSGLCWSKKVLFLPWRIWHGWTEREKVVAEGDGGRRRLGHDGA
jgi:hypothetical protein